MHPNGNRTLEQQRVTVENARLSPEESLSILRSMSLLLLHPSLPPRRQQLQKGLVLLVIVLVVTLVVGIIIIVVVVVSIVIAKRRVRKCRVIMITMTPGKTLMWWSQVLVISNLSLHIIAPTPLSLTKAATRRPVAAIALPAPKRHQPAARLAAAGAEFWFAALMQLVFAAVQGTAAARWCRVAIVVAHLVPRIGGASQDGGVHLRPLPQVSRPAVQPTEELVRLMQ